MMAHYSTQLTTQRSRGTNRIEFYVPLLNSKQHIMNRIQFMQIFIDLKRENEPKNRVSLTRGNERLYWNKSREVVVQDDIHPANTLLQFSNILNFRRFYKERILQKILRFLIVGITQQTVCIQKIPIQNFLNYPANQRTLFKRRFRLFGLTRKVVDSIKKYLIRFQ